jgi:hypothetical protein
MHYLGVNVLAVLVAAVSSFMLGGLWYSAALFGNTWNREAGRPEKTADQRHPGLVFGTSFVLALISAFVFALALGPNPELGFSVRAGFAVGALFVAASFGINYAFASRSLKLWLVDGGYHTAQFMIYGLILGLWH